VVTGSGLSDIFHSTAFQVARNLTMFLVAVFWLGVAYWVYRDARRRLDDSWLVATAAAVGLVPIVGPLVYLLFRPPETLADVRAREIEVRALKAHLRRPEPACPVCKTGVQADYLICPVCTTQLKAPCVECAKPLEPLWQACPYCATPVGRERPQPVPVAVATGEPVAVDLDAALTAEAKRVPQKRRPKARPKQRRAAAG
jgi:hypothetical protein